MNLSSLLRFLEEIGASPKKSLSQNFLIDAHILEKIVALAKVQPEEAILEIGPGPGSLTQILLAKGAKVFAIEKDTLFAKHLSRFSSPNLHVLEGDALECPFDSLLATKVIANLPYHITTPLLERLLPSSFESLTLMVQKEVGERLLAKEGSKTYGSLSIFAQFYATISAHFLVSATCFYPKPSVDSMVLHFDLKRPLPLENPAPFFSMVRLAFQQRRKMLTSSLGSSVDKEILQQALSSLSIRKDARPEMLSLAMWLDLYKKVSSHF